MGRKKMVTEDQFEELELIEINVGNVVAKYKYVGNCSACGERLFKCTTYPITADEMIGSHLAIVVKTGNNTPPDYSCPEHDPGIEIRKSARRHVPQDGAVVSRGY